MIRAPLLIIVPVLLLSGCRDECQAGVDPDYCQDNAAFHCPQPGPDQLVPVRWSREDCGQGVCVLPGGNAVCSLTADPNPACGASAGSACQDATTHLYCSFGYATSTQPCLRCEGSDAGVKAECHGGLGSDCTTDGDCIPALHCFSRMIGTREYRFCAQRDAGS